MDIDALLEAERRNILPDNMKPLLQEARRRGLVPGGVEQQPSQAEPSPGATWGQTLKENLFGDNDDTTQNFGEKVGTFLNKAGESMSFGLVGDEASAAAAAAIPGGRGYGERLDYERQQERLFEETNPGAALAADVGGAVAGAVTPVGAIGTLGRGAGLMSRIGASAGAGAGMGATSAFMEGEGAADRMDQAKMGGILGAGVGAVAPAVGAGVQKLADNRVSNRVIRDAVSRAPSSEGLRAQGNAAYQAIDDAGVSVRPGAVQSRTAEIAKMLSDEGADPILTPNSSRVASRFSDAAEGANTVPFSELDKLRRIAGNAAGANPSNQPDTRLANMARESIDDFVSNLGADDVDAGDIKTLQTMLPKARDLWSRMSKSQMLDDAIDASENYQSGVASGMKNQFRRIVNNPKLRRGFSEPEIKMMRRVVNGTLPEQVVNYLGSGLGMIGQMIGGGVMGSSAGPLGSLAGIAAGGATAAGARKLTENIVKRNAEIARALVASGKVPQTPVASDASRRIVEQLMRRSSTVGPQQ